MLFSINLTLDTLNAWVHVHLAVAEEMLEAGLTPKLLTAVT